MKIPFTNLELSASTKGLSFGISPKMEMRKSSNLFDERISTSSLFQLYKKNSDVRATVDILGNYVGKSGWNLSKNGEVLEKTSSEYITAWNILSGRNDFSKTIKRIVRDIRVAGNSFVEILRNGKNEIVGLNILDPRTISVVANSQGVVLRYVQRVSGSVVIFDTFDILHFIEDTDTDNEAFGIGKVESLFMEAMADVKALSVSYNWYDNDAVPSSYLILDEGIYDNEELTEKLKDEMKYHFSGEKNKGKTGVIPYLKDIKTVSPSLNEFSFLDSRKFSTDKVCATVGVPKFFLGLTENVNNNNAIELLSALYNGSVEPLEQLIADTLTREIFFPLLQCQFSFIQQDFRQAERGKRALEEYKMGILTLRQYKIKTGQEVTQEDEKNSNIDTHIIIKSESKEGEKKEKVS